MSIETKFKKLKSLSFENTQAVLLWCFNLKASHKRKSPSFFTIKNSEKLKSVNVIFNKNISENTKKKLGGKFITINEYLSLEEFSKYLPCEINYENLTLTSICEADIKKFMLKETRLAYCDYQLTIPSEISLYERTIVDYLTPEKNSGYFLISMDCEMLITEKGKEIGRISLLDHNSNILLDEYVQPLGKVVDYMTKYSGLTKEKVEGGINFDELQEKVLSFVGKNTYILGHALENDLQYLKIKHSLLIDTSHIFKTHENKRLRLKHLLLKKLEKEVQNGEHSSVEDSKSCLDLLKYKIAEYKTLKDSFIAKKYLQLEHPIRFYDDTNFSSYKETILLEEKSLNFFNISDDNFTEIFNNFDNSMVNFIFFEEEDIIRMVCWNV